MWDWARKSAVEVANKEVVLYICSVMVKNNMTRNIKNQEILPYLWKVYPKKTVHKKEKVIFEKCLCQRGWFMLIKMWKDLKC